MLVFFLPTDFHVLPTTSRILPTPPQVLPTPYVPTGPAICVDLGLNPASLGNVQFCPIRIKYLSLSVQGIRTDWTGITAVNGTDRAEVQFATSSGRPRSIRDRPPADDWGRPLQVASRLPSRAEEAKHRFKTFYVRAAYTLYTSVPPTCCKGRNAKEFRA